MCLAYAAVPSAGADAPGQLATMMCYTFVYASVCCTGADWARYEGLSKCATRCCTFLRAVHGLLSLTALLGTLL